MKRKFTLTLLWIVMILLAACGKPSSVTIQPELTSINPADAPGTATVEAEPIRVDSSPTATLAPTISIIDAQNKIYELKAEIDYSKRKVSVEESVHYLNTTPQTLGQLVLIVEPNQYAGGFNLKQANIQDSLTAIEYSLEGNRLTLELKPALASGDEIQLYFEYELSLPAIPPPSEQFKPQPYGYTERQMNLVDWYLYIAPISPEGEWLAHKPSYFGEFLVYPYADYHVELSLKNAPGDILVAASAMDRSTEKDRYLYELNGARTFALSLNSGFDVDETTTDGVTVRSYFSNAERAAGEEVLRATADALKLYSELYGKYPRDILSVVEADFLDGMEYDGLFFLSKAFYNLYDGTPKGYLTFIAVHETAHQWFFSQVGNDQALEPWLDEAWCTFSELLYYERYYPELVDWWWYYRVNYYEPIGWIDLPVYDYTGFIAYRNAVYLRGAQFLYELRAALGQEQFFEITKAYVQNQTGKIAGTAEFINAFGLEGGIQEELLAKYFQSNQSDD